VKTKKSQSPLALIKSLTVYSQANGVMVIESEYRRGVPGFPSRMAIANEIEALINAAVKKANGN
jgi:hypothetical protein